MLVRWIGPHDDSWVSYTDLNGRMQRAARRWQFTIGGRPPGQRGTDIAARVKAKQARASALAAAAARATGVVSRRTRAGGSHVDAGESDEEINASFQNLRRLKRVRSEFAAVEGAGSWQQRRMARAREIARSGWGVPLPTEADAGMYRGRTGGRRVIEDDLEDMSLKGDTWRTVQVSQGRAPKRRKR